MSEDEDRPIVHKRRGSLRGVPAPSVVLGDDRRLALEELWFIFGNNGPKASMPNHRWIQNLLEKGLDYRNFYKPSPECIEAVDRILKK